MKLNLPWRFYCNDRTETPRVPHYYRCNNFLYFMVAFNRYACLPVFMKWMETKWENLADDSVTVKCNKNAKRAVKQSSRKCARKFCPGEDNVNK